MCLKRTENVLCWVFLSSIFGEMGSAAVKMGFDELICFSAVIDIMHIRFLCSYLTGNDTVYWTDMGLNRISRAKRDQTWREDVITTGISRVEGIAVDWIAGLNSHCYICFHTFKFTICLL